MGSTVLDILTDISRFWFILIALYVLIRIVDNSLAEFSFRRSMHKSGPGRFFGFVTVIGDKQSENYGARFGLKWENSIGSGKSCDITIPDKRIKKLHANIYLSKEGAYIIPYSATYINEERAGKNQQLTDGDEIMMGGVRLRLRLEMEEEG